MSAAAQDALLTLLQPASEAAPHAGEALPDPAPQQAASYEPPLDDPAWRAWRQEAERPQASAAPRVAAPRHVEVPDEEDPSDRPDEDNALGQVDLLLRDRERLLDRVEEGRDLLKLSRVMLVTVCLGAAAFGAAVGVVRGGEQIAYAAIKLPVALLLTAGLCVPALSALRRAFQGAWQVKRDVALVLASLGLTSLVMAATAPLILMARSFHAGYHQMILMVAACAGLSGLVGLHLFARGFERWVPKERLTLAVVLLTLFAMVGSQMTWTLRPWVVRPKTEQVPFVRPIEGSFFDAVITTWSSSRGIYHGRVERGSLGIEAARGPAEAAMPTPASELGLRQEAP